MYFRNAAFIQVLNLFVENKIFIEKFADLNVNLLVVIPVVIFHLSFISSAWLFDHFTPFKVRINFSPRFPFVGTEKIVFYSMEKSPSNRKTNITERKKAERKVRKKLITKHRFDFLIPNGFIPRFIHMVLFCVGCA